MIFVTVGTHEQPFNRLIQKIDELEENADVVQPFYDFVLKHIDLGEDEMVQKYLENIE